MEKLEVLIGQQWVEVLAKLSDDFLILSIDESSEGHIDESIILN